jgi:acyl dehydratase
VAGLADVTWSMPPVVVQPAVLERYREVCGFQAAHGVPMTYPQLLTFPLVMAYLSSPDCPWPAVGTVHLANAIEQREPLRAGDEVRVTLRTGALRVHEKGQVFDLELTVTRDGDWIWRGTQSLLRRGVAQPAGVPYVSALPQAADLQRSVSFEAPVNIGRRYAPVSGDFNPMHWSSLGARLLGFRRMIAHGLWTQARALAAVQTSIPLRKAALTTEFKSPLLLPARVAVWQARHAAQLRFDVRDAGDDRLHLCSLLTEFST